MKNKNKISSKYSLVENVRTLQATAYDAEGNVIICDEPGCGQPAGFLAIGVTSQLAKCYEHSPYNDTNARIVYNPDRLKKFINDYDPGSSIEKMYENSHEKTDNFFKNAIPEPNNDLWIIDLKKLKKKE